jgi:hypothetical protein
MILPFILGMKLVKLQRFKLIAVVLQHFADHRLPDPECVQVKAQPFNFYIVFVKAFPGYTAEATEPPLFVTPGAAFNIAARLVKVAWGCVTVGAVLVPHGGIRVRSLHNPKWDQCPPDA